MTMGDESMRYHGITISSTFEDLKHHRQALIKVINDNGLMHVAMENSTALADAAVIKSSKNMVANGSAYILIIGARYGQVPICTKNNADQLSITELEFNHAERLGRPTLLFLMGDTHPVARADVEKDPAKQVKLDAFIARAKKCSAESKEDRVYCTFNSLEEFALQAAVAVGILKQSLDAPPTAQVSAPTALQVFQGIRAPALYANPRYLGSHRFLGRTDQLRSLNEWAQKSDSHPVLLFEAIGGSGKSILSWTWLTERSADLRSDWAGRFWYSFYERGAQTRDFLLQALAYMHGKLDEAWARMGVPELAEDFLSQLGNRPWLLVLDGIERLLVDYNRFDAEYRADELAGTEDQISKRPPLAMIRDEDSELFRALLMASPSKILITSRLLPRCMVNAAHQPLPGLLHQRLPGLHAEDAEGMLRACGVSGESTVMRAYLKENCDCHPLVIGMLAGLINRYLPARGDFDRWRTAAQGGLALDLATLDLAGRRNHILRFALDALPESSRELLGTLAMVLNEFDYRVLVALRPSDASESQSDLATSVADLEEHGFLLFDRKTGLYDLHPVVRSVVIGNLVPNMRERAGGRVIDYFSAAAAKPLSEAQTLDDVLPALHVVQTYLTMGKLEQAWRSFEPALFEALWLNLELHERNLALLRPFFSDGWRTVHETVPRKMARELFNHVGICLAELGLQQEACACSIAYFQMSYEDGASLSTPLLNLGHSIYKLGSHRLALRIFDAARLLAEATCDDQSLFLSHCNCMRIQGALGNRDAADDHWRALDPLGRDWHVSQYRAGSAEYRRLYYLQQFDAIDESALQAAEEIAGRNRTSRLVRRSLLRLRGQWHLRQGQYKAACASLELAARMAREAGQRDAEAETAMALAKQLDCPHPDTHQEAIRLAGETDRAELELALLWEALGERGRALQHAMIACTQACKDGEPWVLRPDFERAQALIERLGGARFRCPPHDAGKGWPVSWRDYPDPEVFFADLDRLIERCRNENKDRIERHANRSLEERQIASRGHLIHKLKAKDTTGRWAYYFVLVPPAMEAAFLKSIEGNGIVDLESYGKIVASCYGEQPSQEVRDYLYAKFGFSV